jgi:hypothetical protein
MVVDPRTAAARRTVVDRTAAAVADMGGNYAGFFQRSKAA